MKVIIWSRKVAGLELEGSAWAVATGQVQAVVFNQGEDGPYCRIIF